MAAIKACVADAAESWKATHSDKERFNIVCKQQRSCTFRILELLIQTLPHRRAAISAKQIQSAERLQYFNNISYLQAYRVKQAILTEMWGDESESFALFPDYIARFKAADRTYISTLSNGSRFLLLLMEPIQNQGNLQPSTSIIAY